MIKVVDLRMFFVVVSVFVPMGDGALAADPIVSYPKIKCEQAAQVSTGEVSYGHFLTLGWIYEGFMAYDGQIFLHEIDRELLGT